MTTDPEERQLSGVRQRSRRAIVDAAVALWARDFSASLGEIAEGAEVSRSTLHRHFPDRKSLVAAALAHAIDLLDRETKTAVEGCRNATEELEALLRVLIDAGDALIFLFSDPNRFADHPYWNQAEDEELPGVIARAQAEGSLDAQMPPAWIVDVFYAVCYVAAEAVAAAKLPRHRAADTAVRTFFHGVGPRPEPGGSLTSASPRT